LLQGSDDARFLLSLAFNPKWIGYYISAVSGRAPVLDTTLDGWIGKGLTKQLGYLTLKGVTLDPVVLTANHQR